MLYNTVMLCYITYVMLCYITCVMLCYKTYVIICYITCVMLCLTEQKRTELVMLYKRICVMPRTHVI